MGPYRAGSSPESQLKPPLYATDDIQTAEFENNLKKKKKKN